MSNSVLTWNPITTLVKRFFFFFNHKPTRRGRAGEENNRTVRSWRAHDHAVIDFTYPRKPNPKLAMRMAKTLPVCTAESSKSTKFF